MDFHLILSFLWLKRCKLDEILEALICFADTLCDARRVSCVVSTHTYDVSAS